MSFLDEVKESNFIREVVDIANPVMALFPEVRDVLFAWVDCVGEEEASKLTKDFLDASLHKNPLAASWAALYVFGFSVKLIQDRLEDYKEEWT
ncbi:MAG: hypothetical protein FJY85_11165 [Deltaproteobacteria bacterium]|nr:hypothetical protein [Deltaproteobacteria bacterium]